MRINLKIKVKPYHLEMLNVIVAESKEINTISHLIREMVEEKYWTLISKEDENEMIEDFNN